MRMRRSPVRVVVVFGNSDMPSQSRPDGRIDRHMKMSEATACFAVLYGPEPVVVDRRCVRTFEGRNRYGCCGVFGAK
ncbi:MAG: hypothetical protein D6741_05360 [Planctomycetota bacterium]|nr:MAG: hypothetical protein D6741_05360 [Planctomycetota bacterium]